MMKNFKQTKRMIIALALGISISAAGGLTDIPKVEAGSGPVYTLTAIGDGKTDITAQLNALIKQAAAVNGKVYIPKGVYLIDAVTRVRLMSNVDLVMGSSTVLKAIPNASEYYAILNIANVSNVNIKSGVLVGERYQHLGTTGEWGRGVYIAGANNVVVDGTVAKDCWGDGFNIGIGTGGVNSTNITLKNVVADNNRRQGLSLTSGENILIQNSTFKNTNGGGSGVGAGIDIEPNSLNEKLKNIVLQDVTTSNNVAAGIIINLVKFNGNTDANAVSITINNHKDIGSDRGMFITDVNAVVKGTVNINNPVWTNSDRNGLAIMNHNSNSFTINVNSPTIINPNTSLSTSPATASAIAYYSWDTNKIGGNVSINNVTVKDAANAKLAFFLYSGAGTMLKTTVTTTSIDPILNGKVLYTNDQLNVKTATAI